MGTILICPGERAAVAFLAQSVPLVGVPILGQSLLAHWMSHLASAGTSEVTVLATDRPEMVRALLGNGSRWGINVQVQSELDELTPEMARAKYTGNGTLSPSQASEVIVLDHLPGLSELPLFRSYVGFFHAVISWLPHAAAQGRIGLRQIQEGVWAGLRAQIAPSARLHAPCWIGDFARVGSESAIGPNTVLESGVVVEAATEIGSSIIGPDTFVGKLVRIEDSIAWGNTLIHWRTGSCTEITDAFLLCSLGQRYLPEGNKGARRIDGGLRAALVRSWNMVAELPGKFRANKPGSPGEPI
jgi:NDP-sugar pyrophosphorylase family protein